MQLELISSKFLLPFRKLPSLNDLNGILFRLLLPSFLPCQPSLKEIRNCFLSRLRPTFRAVTFRVFYENLRNKEIVLKIKIHYTLIRNVMLPRF